MSLLADGWEFVINMLSSYIYLWIFVITIVLLCNRGSKKNRSINNKEKDHSTEIDTLNENPPIVASEVKEDDESYECVNKPVYNVSESVLKIEESLKDTSEVKEGEKLPPTQLDQISNSSYDNQSKSFQSVKLDYNSTKAPSNYKPNELDSKASKPIKPPSLSNYGANCYLNSALQGISSCDKYVKDIECIYNENKDLKKLSVFHQLILILNGGKVNRMEISQNQIFREWNKSDQKDIFELLAYVINQVYNEIRQSKENADIIPKRDMQKWLSIPLPMRIIIEYKIRCECGSIVDVPLQSDLALHVTIPLKQDFDLQTLVNQFFNKDRIEDHECGTDACSGRGAIRFTRLRDPLPTTICIHLQRTFWNGYKMMKIDKTIEFSKILKIKSEYRTFGNIEALHMEKKINENIDKNNSSEIYNDRGDTNSTIPNHPKYSFSENMHIEEASFCAVSNDGCDTSSTIVPDLLTQEHKSDATKTVEEAVHDLSSEKLNSEASKTKKVAHDLFFQEPRSNSTETKHESMYDTQSKKADFIINNYAKDETYRLTSVIVHYGLVYGGHYVCYKFLDGRWFLTDDSHIREVSECDVLKCNPYILFYEKS